MHLDMEFLFQYSTQQFKRKRREQAGYRVEHEQRNSISTSSHVLIVYHSQGWQSARARMWPRWRHATGGLGGQWNSPMLITKRSLRKNLQLPGQVEVYRFSLDDRTIEVIKWFVEVLHTKETKHLFRQKSLIYIRRCARLPIHSSTQTRSKTIQLTISLIKYLVKKHIYSREK